MNNRLLIHKHLIIRAEVSNPPKDTEFLKKWMEEFISFIDMKIMMGPYVAYCDKPGNRGITGVAVIETSHIAMHVWDEPNPAMMQFDVYSCAEFDPYKIAEKIKQDFKVERIDYKFLNRETGLKPIRLKKSNDNNNIQETT
jgi:S-adenosylmethionine/arginine decarboxylase-like enzyme